MKRWDLVRKYKDWRGRYKITTKTFETEKALRKEIAKITAYLSKEQRHEDIERGYLANGTFFSTSSNEASSYGKNIYKIELKKDLTAKDVQAIVDAKTIAINAAMS